MQRLLLKSSNNVLAIMKTCILKKDNDKQSMGSSNQMKEAQRQTATPMILGVLTSRIKSGETTIRIELITS